MSDNFSEVAIRGNPEWGYWLNFSPSVSDVTHVFCGQHEIEGADCPNCKKPLLRILSLNTKDERLRIDTATYPFVHLLYCWTCSIPYGRFSYKIGSKGGVELVEVPAGYADAFGPEGPYDGYIGKYPERIVGLTPLADEEQNYLETCRELDVSEEELEELDEDGEIWRLRHQIGGSPFIYNPQPVTCPGCSESIPLLAAICDNAAGAAPGKATAESTFTDNPGVQMIFHFCRSCLIVVAYHSVD